MHFRLKMLLIALATLLLGGCNALVTAPRPVALFDLGLTEPLAVADGVAPSQIQVVSPSWLASSAMQYRLLWDQPARRRVFVESRWVATPSELVGRSLERALLGTNARPNECRLKIELDEFAQVFETADKSRVELVARATWLAARGERPLARRSFQLSADSQPANAEQGVAVYRNLSAQLARQLADWLIELDRIRAQALNADSACRN
ncbi:membrane integrity-associated transporter subunit PqiC [Azoarcus sp. L1K30]|uniref:ABC-type transport auxiliary lipoprotein family protein n=1 Tax=Azoarcus sp. L1K30 TaxID=2820277 RepID=UPI001B82DFC2|nr:ABC-type transport auxiliary lipoprotein family protein [Azoarcus sp. L1K30]MBR0565278.1 membrane integrity-associated transporter subunit PqiC [Azoarcus sp. L1K30]